MKSEKRRQDSIWIRRTLAEQSEVIMLFWSCGFELALRVQAIVTGLEINEGQPKGGIEARRRNNDHYTRHDNSMDQLRTHFCEHEYQPEGDKRETIT